MFTAERSIFINRPPQEVFDYSSDPANAHKWQSQVLSQEWSSDGPPGVGSTQRAVARFLGRDLESAAEITIWDPPSQHGFKSIGGPVHIEGGMKFAPEGDGTKVTMGGQLETSGFFKLAEGLVKKQLESQFEANLEALKLLLESGPA